MKYAKSASIGTISVLMLTVSISTGVLFSSSVYAETTQRRNIIDFCESYSYRAGKYEGTKEGSIFDFHPLSGHFLDSSISGELFVSTSCGTGVVYIDDFTIKEMTLTLADLRDSDIQNERHTAEFVLGFSALEFDDLGEHMLSLNAKVNGGEENATDESFRIFNDIIVPSLTEEIISKVMNNDEEILVYSGNYDYYLSYYHISREETDHEYLYMTAKERE